MMNMKNVTKNLLSRFPRIKVSIPQVFVLKTEDVQDAALTEQNKTQLRAMEAAKNHAITSVRRTQWKV